MPLADQQPGRRGLSSAGTSQSKDCPIAWGTRALHIARSVGSAAAAERRDNHLFDAFYTTKPGGMGMGLSICRSIIEAHGGQVWATANVPQGAIFQFILPMQRETAP